VRNEQREKANEGRREHLMTGFEPEVYRAPNSTLAANRETAMHNDDLGVGSGFASSAWGIGKIEDQVEGI